MRKIIALGIMLLFLGMTICSSTGTRMFNNDNEPPVTTCILDPPEPNGENGYYVSNVTVTLTSWDDDGVRKIYYRIPGSEWMNQSGDNVSFVLDYDCLNGGLIEYYAIDNLGFQEEVKSKEIDMDQLPPYMECVWETYQEDWIWLVKFNVTAGDNCSGIVDRLWFYINDGLHMIIEGGPPYEFIFEYPWVFMRWTIYFYIYDIAGNAGVIQVNDSDIDSYCYNQINNFFKFSNIWFFGLLERFPILNRLIMQIMERWSI